MAHVPRELWKNPRVEVVSYDVTWPILFERAEAEVRTMLGPLVLAMHHIGSTAVPGLAAKPVIDMLLEVKTVDSLDALAVIEAMGRIGYHAQGEFGLPGRRYFVRGRDPRTHQIHAYATGDPSLARHLAFRDYLRAHPDIAAEYGSLKRKLAQSSHHDIEVYMAGKDAFVKDHEAKALRWQTGR